MASNTEGEPASEINQSTPTSSQQSSGTESGSATPAQRVPEARDNMGRTDLSLAVMTGDVNRVRQLLQHGSSANARDRKGLTPLHHACALPTTSAAGADIVALLLESCDDPNRVTKRCLTALMVHCHISCRAAGVYSSRVVQMLLDGCDLLRPRDRNQRSHLHWAVRSRSPALFRQVIQRWPLEQITVLDRFAKNVLFDAIAWRQEEIALELLSIPQIELVKTLMTQENAHHMLPMQRTAQENAVAVVSRMVQLGADINVCSGTENRPIVNAARACALDALEYITKHPECDINAPVSFNQTALFITTLTYFRYHRANTVRRIKRPSKPFLKSMYLLLRVNADTTVLSDCGAFRTARQERPQSALDIAVKGGLHDATMLLLYAGAPLGALRPDIFDTSEPQLNRYLAANLELVGKVREFHQTPRALKNLCRMYIRSRLGSSFRFTVNNLRLPPPLVEFLRLGDLAEFVARETAPPEVVDGAERAGSDFEYEISEYDSDEHLDPLDALED